MRRPARRSSRRMRAALAAALLFGLAAGPAFAERAQVKGEVVDTWCYLSGVMGGPDAVVGTAHHTCAVWCAAGGIPVGLLAEDGTLYMVLKIAGAGTADGPERILSIQSHQVTADGEVYKRDGLTYLIVDKVVADEGVLRQTHKEFGFVPPNAVSDEEIARIKKQ